MLLSLCCAALAFVLMLLSLYRHHSFVPHAVVIGTAVLGGILLGINLFGIYTIKWRKKRYFDSYVLFAGIVVVIMIFLIGLMFFANYDSDTREFTGAPL